MAGTHLCLKCLCSTSLENSVALDTLHKRRSAHIGKASCGKDGHEAFAMRREIDEVLAGRVFEHGVQLEDEGAGIRIAPGQRQGQGGRLGLSFPPGLGDHAAQFTL
jgi:hypothetical protein